MANHIVTPSKEKFDIRIGYFNDVQEMSTAKDLTWVGQDCLDVFFAR